MKSFARATRLPDISGRGDYIANPERQECIVAASPKVDWSEYVQYERYNQKTEERNNEGREVVIQLPNEWAELSPEELHRRGELLAQTVTGTNHERQWAIHWNKDHTNLHIHVIFSERERIKEPGVWDRNIYLSKTNQVARRKADRMTDEDGNYILIHRKGEAKEPFSAKDPKFSSRQWLHEVKAEIRSKLEEFGVKFERDNWLPQHHQGKGKDSADITRRNGIIMENNRRLDCLYDHGLPVDDLVKQAKAVRSNTRSAPGETFIPIIFYDARAKEFRVDVCFDTSAAVKRIDQTKDFYEKVSEILAAKEEKAAAPEKAAPAEPAQKPQQAAPEAHKPEPDTEGPMVVSVAQKAQETSPEAREPEPEREFRPAAPAAQKPSKKPSEQLKEAFEDFEKAQRKVGSARYEWNMADELPFWNREKKAKKEAANQKLAAARSECAAAFDRVVSYGISTYRDGVELSGSELGLGDMKYLSDLVDRKIGEMERSEAYEKKMLSKVASLDERIAQSKEKQQEQESQKQESVEISRKSSSRER